MERLLFKKIKIKEEYIEDIEDMRDSEYQLRTKI